jgi:cyclopropane-fatty-acyl-phospholipid synthase
VTRNEISETARPDHTGLGLFGRGVAAALGRLKYGALEVAWPDGRRLTFEGTEPGPRGTIVVRDPACVRRMVLGGSIGLAEGYMSGQWDSPDLTAFLEFAAMNVDAVREAGKRVTAPLNPLNRALHSLKDNTPRGSKRNIGYHYDLGNDFYALWLDPDMTYSCALFDGSECDLAEAQRRKWDRLLDLLDARPGQRLLEIGCGWGGFAIHAAKTRELHVTGITISDEQLAWAERRVAEEGLTDRVEVRHQDYRSLDERFDRVASIEMFEAVGMRWWPTFFRSVHDALAEGGRAAIQVITIDDDRLDDYAAKPDFIQRYIFPGGMLPSPEAFERSAATEGLACERPFFFGSDYAMTLRAWEERFSDTVQRVRGLGFDERFERMWRFYLSYCQAGFRTGSIDVMQVALTRA